MNSFLAPLTKLTPAPIVEFLHLALAHGFTPYLVGGAVRDLCMGSERIYDWDFELHHPQGSDSKWQALLSSLRLKSRLLPQAHHVIKAQIPDMNLEWQFAPPRVETYQSRESYAHGDFDAKVAWVIPFEKAALRRDFTVNAMGARFDGSWTLVDPFTGLEHINKKLLHCCDKVHFAKDPVRYLRAQRFALKFGWSFSDELSDVLENMDLSLLTPHYLGEEARKSFHPFHFWNGLQSQATLPTKFQGGLLHPEKLDLTYQKQLPEFGHSNAMLAAVFSHGEGWHLLLPLAGKGESEATLWRHRRDNILALKDKTMIDFIEVDELLLKSESFKKLCELLRPPQVWLGWAWVRDVFQHNGLSWIIKKPWIDSIDVRSFPPHERAGRKVIAWLRA